MHVDEDSMPPPPAFLCKVLIADKLGLDLQLQSLDSIGSGGGRRMYFVRSVGADWQAALYPLVCVAYNCHIEAVVAV
jgi:hypothetical protein